jgi:WD40 repeat protein
LTQTLSKHKKWVWDAVFSLDGAYLVSASSDGTARLWDLASGDALRVYSGHHKAVVCPLPVLPVVVREHGEANRAGRDTCLPKSMDEDEVPE